MKLDVNGILARNGYKSRTDFREVAQFAVELCHENPQITEKQLLEEVGGKFCHPAAVNMKANRAPLNMFVPSGGIDGAAMEQINTALRLPCAVQGALLPDAHSGYSLPIGGVVALDHAISPAFVGLDIGCRMRMTVLGGIPTNLTAQDKTGLLDAVLASTSFGIGATSKADHDVVNLRAWDEIESLKKLHQLAVEQLGSQGAGNHFADVMVGHGDGIFLPQEFVAFVTHSGSRGTGNKLGKYYSDLADKECSQRNIRVPKQYGYFDSTWDSGREYFIVMQIMLDYASANHEIAHNRFLETTGLTAKKMIENHHNFAFVEKDGLVVHRKGATPAHDGELGVIPGTSGTKSYVVVGKGNPDSLMSASHGAGRPFSRSQAKKSFDSDVFKLHMREMGIVYHGIAEDESFMAYKDIESVMHAQRDLVNIVAEMTPVVVVMGGGRSSDDGD